MFSELKALVDSDNSELSLFSTVQKTIARNSEFSLPSMISRVMEKFRVIFFMHRAKNDNSELGIHLTGNSDISEFSENSELSLWPFFESCKAKIKV